MPLPRDAGVVLVAGGRGLRLGGATPKQYLPIGGVPMLLRALRPFTSHPDVARTVVVLPPEDAAAPPAWLAPLLGETLAVAAGGAERMDSVANGVAALGDGVTIVLVHDAARPLVTQPVIDRVLAAARAGEAALPAVPVSDTLKEGDPAEPTRVARTVPRERLWRAQTPQGFPRALLAEAHARGRAEGLVATDDAQLVERLGGTVRLVPGDARNIKVTTPEDLALAELLAGQAR